MDKTNDARLLCPTCRSRLTMTRSTPEDGARTFHCATCGFAMTLVIDMQDAASIIKQNLRSSVGKEDDIVSVISELQAEINEIRGLAELTQERQEQAALLALANVVEEWARELDRSV
jgi:Zn ribbon nucleic-acid-binding protein